MSGVFLSTGTPGPICVQGLEVGFGSPSIFNRTTGVELVGDAGFGSPDVIDGPGVRDFCVEAETGFGDPWENITLAVEGDVKLSDQGGDLLELRGRFDLIFDTFDIEQPQFEKAIGPFFAKFISQDVANREYDAISALPLLKTQLYTNTTQNAMQLAAPPMIQGTYTLRIFYGQGRVEYIDFPENVEVVHRLRNDKVLSIKNQMPGHYNVGIKTDHSALSGQYFKRDENNFSKIISAVGQNFNHMYNQDYTLTTAAHNRNVSILNVETTLGFPEKGTLFINDGQTLEYTGRTNTSFTGISGMSSPIEKRVRVSKPNDELTTIDNYYKIQNNGFFKPLSNISEEEWLTSFNIVEFNERHSEQVIFLSLIHI